MSKKNRTRIFGLVGFVLTFIAWPFGQSFYEAMGYYFPHEYKYDYKWLVFCILIAMYFLVVIISGNFKLFKKSVN